MNTVDGLPVPQRYWAVLTVAIGIIMSVLDSSIANIALPTIARELKTTAAESIWVVNAYQFAVTIALIPAASLGDIWGYRRVYAVGLAVFTLASLACALSPSLPLLALSRVVQGLGAAGIMAVSAALVRFIYPRARLGRGMGINALVVATSAAIGPSLAAAILAALSWHWLFAVNVPFGLAAMVMARRFLPVTEGAGHRFDLPSAALNAATLGSLVAGIEGLGHGTQPLAVALCFAVTLFGGLAFVRRQVALPAPMLPVDLFKRPVFSLAVAASISSYAAQGMAYVSLPFYFQEVLGRSQVETGLLMTPWPLTVAIVAPIAGRLSDRYAAGMLGGLGLAALSLGFVLIALLPEAPDVTNIMWRMTICGLGFGFFQSPNNRAIIASVPRARSGSAGGIIASARLLGQTSGAALVSLIFGLVAGAPGGFARSTTVAVTLGAAFAAIGAAASSLRLFDDRGRAAPHPGE